MEEVIPKDVNFTTIQTNPQEPEQPMAEVKCGCKAHPRHRILDIEAPLSVNSFFNGFFMSDDDALIRLAHGRRETENIIVDPWRYENELESRKLRYCVKYKTPLSLFSQSSRAFEQQTILQKDFDRAYVVETTVSTPDVPGGQGFSSIMRYCFTSIDTTHSILRTTGKVTFSRKSIFGKKIETMSVEGSRNFMTNVDSLLKEVDFNLDELSIIEKNKSAEINLQRKVSILEESLRKTSMNYISSEAENQPQSQFIEGPRMSSGFSFGLFDSNIRGSIKSVFFSLISWIFKPYIILHILTILCTMGAISNFLTSMKIIHNLDSVNSLTLATLPT